MKSTVFSPKCLNLRGAGGWSSWTPEDPPACVQSAFWTCLLGHTHYKSCVAYRDRLPTWHLSRLKGGLKCTNGLTWCNTACCAHHEWSGRQLFTTWPNPELRRRAIDAGWSFFFLFFLSPFCVLFCFRFLLSNRCTVVAVISPRKLKHCSHICLSLLDGDGATHLLFKVKQ